jgi:hypothetical protein
VASIDHELDDGVLAATSRAGHGADRTTLTEHVEDAGTSFTVQTVHVTTPINSLDNLVP